VAAASQAGSNIFVRRLGKVRVVPLIVWSSLFAWPPLLAMSLILEGPERIAHALGHPSWSFIGAVVYISYPVTLLGFALWSRLLSLYPAAIVSSFTLLVPVLAAVSSALLLGEEIQGWKMTATAVVLLGLCVGVLGPQLAARMRQRVVPAPG
jgi:O-acetylserine/cysteine efflux transporter